jgi:acetyl-CoA carboxylase carboxyltransferase component
MILSYTAPIEQAAGYVRSLVSFLPSNKDVGVIANSSTDNVNRLLGELDFAGDGRSMLSVVADNGLFYELSADFATAVVTAFATIAGVKCGVVASSFANNEGRIDAAVARKIAKFVNLCSSFSVPVVTLVDSLGTVIDKNNEEQYFAAELAKLAHAYVSSDVPKVTVINGHAIGASFVLLGSKALGADLVYTTHNSEICALSADSGVAFAWDKHITLEKSREELVDEWCATVSSPARAAASGEIDDIISVNEMRARICSALLMLTEKNIHSLGGRKILPL